MRMFPFISRTVVATVWLALLPGTVHALQGLRQISDPEPSRKGVYGGINLSLGAPTGEFNQNVDVSPGFGLNLVIPFNGSGSIGVLIQTGVLIYGSQSRNISISGTGGLIDLKLRTTNYLGFIGAGLQYAPRQGAIRPYVNGTLGGSYLATETSLSGSNSTTNFDDFVFTATGGGGLYLPLGKRQQIAIDLGTQFHLGGPAKYLTESGIIDNGNGTTSFNPSTSRTDFVRIQLGIEFKP